MSSPPGNIWKKFNQFDENRLMIIVKLKILNGKSIAIFSMLSFLAEYAYTLVKNNNLRNESIFIIMCIFTLYSYKVISVIYIWH